MTKREQAALLFAKLTEMAAGNPNAMAALNATATEYSGDPIKKGVKSSKIGGEDGIIFDDDSELSLETFVSIDWTDPNDQRHKDKFELESENLYNFDKIQAGSNGTITIDAKLVLSIDWFWSNPEEIQEMRFDIPFTSDPFSAELKAGDIKTIDMGGKRDALPDVNPEIKIDLIGTNTVSVYGGAIVGAMTFSRTTKSGHWEVSGSYSRESSSSTKDGDTTDGSKGTGTGSGKYVSGTVSETETRAYKEASLVTINPRFKLNLQDVQQRTVQSESDLIFFEQIAQSKLSEVSSRTIAMWWINEKKKYNPIELHNALSEGNYTFVVFGYADKQGPHDYNKNLGMRRASTIVKELKTMVDFSEQFPNNFSAKSYGESLSMNEDNMKDRKAYIQFTMKK